jgi:D-alanine-D-alanine ligase
MDPSPVPLPADGATPIAAPGRRPRVAVVFGGRSSEHAISCVTAAGVMGALDRSRYDVVPIGITRQGRWVLASDDPARWAIQGDRLPEVTAGAGARALLPQSVDDDDVVVLAPGEVPRTLGAVDVVFPVLHGPYGEDGTLQGMLELSDTRYVGAGVLSSAMSMDKHYMKIVLAGHGLPVAPYVAVRPREWERDPSAVAAAVAALGFPVFVKPARAGSSFGVTRVAGPDGLAAAVEAARVHDPKVLVEQAVVGREVECAVLQDLGDGPPLTSLPGEIEVVAGHDFYDFEAKYLDESNVRLTCPADLDEEVSDRVRDLSARTFEAMACEGLARVDVFVTADGSVVVNELNTMPGFTPTSMYPRMWERSGLGYAALVDHLVRLALTRPVGLR